jgi:hypothetical protein
MIISILNYFFKFQIFFRYYLLVIFFINLYIFYVFTINQIIKLKKNIINVDNNIDNNNNVYDDNKYCHMLKKIKKIINNPIIFEYQLIQSDKIDINSNKYIKYHKELNNINKNNEQFIKSQEYLNKIKKILSSENKYNISDIDIITKLLYINF